MAICWPSQGARDAERLLFVFNLGREAGRVDAIHRTFRSPSLRLPGFAPGHEGTVMLEGLDVFCARLV
jgi:alpha-glucosidase